MKCVKRFVLGVMNQDLFRPASIKTESVLFYLKIGLQKNWKKEKKSNGPYYFVEQARRLKVDPGAHDRKSTVKKTGSRLSIVLSLPVFLTDRISVIIR